MTRREGLSSPLAWKFRVLAGGIIPLMIISCGGTGSAPTRDAQSTVGGSVDAAGVSGSAGAAGGSGEGGSTPDAGTGTNLGGSPQGSATGGVAGGAVTGGTSVSAAGGTQTSGTGRSSTGGSMLSAGSTATGGSSGKGGAAPGGTTSTGGSVSPGGTTGTGGTIGTSTTGGPSFPARFVGNIDTQGKVAEDFLKYWDQLTPETAGKWPSVQPTSGDKFNWTVLDTLYAYAEEHKIPFKEMTFVWGSSHPVWIGNLTTTTGPEAVKRWMKSFCDRYPNTRLIDVVNEPPPHTSPPFANAIGGGSNTTWDWVINSFKWAREACPNAVLSLNDYNIIEYASENKRFIDLVNTIKQAGAPIDAIGCQTHGADKLASSTLKPLLEKLINDTGLPVYITEYDIGLADDEQQRAQYADHIPMFWDNPKVKGVTVWGYRYGATFRANTNLLRSDGSARPAMTWLMDFLKR
jgi:endo-1,4-beta-xylanase